MRIVITGDGEIAYQLALALHQQHDVVIIENDPREADRFSSLDVQLLRGDATHPEVLREAGTPGSDSFISCRASDELNIIACLTAKRIGCTHATCFVSKEDYVRSFAGIPEGDDALAIDRIIWPQYMLAEEITRIVLVPRAIDVEIFAGGRIWLMEFKLREDSALIGPLPRLQLPLGVLAVAVRKGDELSIPSGKTELESGDRVAFMGNRGGLRQLRENFIRGPEGTDGDRDVVIVGGGTVGLTLAKRLTREKGYRLKIIERDRDRSEHLAAELPRALVLHGDGTDLALLEAEQVDRSNVLVSVTSNDQSNLLCSLLARQMDVPKIITRVNRKRNIRLFERVGIDVPLNPMVTAINVVLNSLQETGVQLLASIEGGQAAVIEMNVSEHFERTRVRNLPRIEGSIIVAVTRADRTTVPHGDDMIEPGDRLLVFSTETAHDKLRKLF